MMFAKGKGKGKGKVVKQEEPKDEEIEDDDDDEDESIAGDDEEWMAFQATVLSKLVTGGTLSAGKLGHILNAKKKPVAAALFGLMESGLAERKDGIPPKWSARPGIDISEFVEAPVAERFTYDASKKRANPGPRASQGDFDTFKNLVRSHLSTNGSGATAGAIGYKLNATKKVVNAALYACEKEGTAWTISDPESGTKLRWGGTPVKCNAAVPAAYAYGGRAVGGGVVAEPAAKRQKTGPTGTTGDDFNDMKMLCWFVVASKGEKGISSGALGHEIQADRKAITAALYSCAESGFVENIAPGGPPRWAARQEPPPEASTIDVPAKFCYKGAKPNNVQSNVNSVAAMVPTVAVTQPTVVAKPPAGDLSAKRQLLLARKGGGKGMASVAANTSAPIAVAPKAASALPESTNAIAFLNEWAQKSKKSLNFAEAGQDGSGNFVCQCSVDGQVVAVSAARNKKQAKAAAAAAAMQNLGLG